MREREYIGTSLRWLHSPKFWGSIPHPIGRIGDAEDFQTHSVNLGSRFNDVAGGAINVPAAPKLSR
jgi:hypothetical protein